MGFRFGTRFVVTHAHPSVARCRSMIAGRSGVLIASLLAVALGACQSSATASQATTPAPHRVATGDTEHGIDLAVGQLLEVPLYGNASTGYSWDRIPAPADANHEVLADAGSAGLPSATAADTSTGAVGAGGTRLYRYRAMRPGTTTLKMVYRRSWETDVPPAATVTLTVRVH